MRSSPTDLIPWDSLTREAQISLRERYGYYLDNLPPSCSLESKIARFQHWLEAQGVAYSG
ncbi:MAG: hypothetical protein ABFS45_17650 [Pseudomonadota bacterium]